MFYHNINPSIVQIGDFEIRWYALMYIISFALGYLLIVYFAKKRKLDLDKKDVGDLLLYIVLGVLVGARLGHVIPHFRYYLNKPIEIFMIHKGGLAFYGGFIMVILISLIFCKKRKINFYDLADIVVIPAAIGLALGRIGNFINGELVGRPTDVSWGVNFRGHEGFRHPSQLYESAKNFLIFGSLWFLEKRKLKKGILFWSFVTLYGVLRFFVEFFREPDFLVLGINHGQLLGLIMFVAGIIMVFNINRKTL